MAHIPERRSERRIAFRIPAYVYVGDSQEHHKGYVMNLSGWGLFATVEDKVTIGAAAHVWFDISPATRCEAYGDIVRTMGFGYGVGFGVQLNKRNPGYANFLRNIESSNEQDLMAYIRDIGRIYIRLW